MIKKSSIFGLLLLISSTSHAALITFDDVTQLGTLTPDITTEGVTVSFGNLQTIDSTFSTAGFGGSAGANVVVSEDQLDFSGNFLTAYGYGRGQFRPTDFERLISFDIAVADVGMYLADIDAGQDTILQALDIDGNILDQIALSANIINDSRAIYAGFDGLSGIGSLLIIGNDPLGIDNLSFTSTAVPEPSTLFLLSAGMIGLIGYSRRKTK